MNARSLVVGFVVGVLMARAYTAQLAQLALLGSPAYIYGSAVQGVQGQLLNAPVIVDHVRLAIGTALISLGVLVMALVWPAVERLAMGFASVLDSVREVSAAYNSGEAKWHR